MIIIGLAGTNGSGKDTIAKMLVERHGFYFASAGDMLIEELKKRGIPEERKNTSALSAEWRKEHGLGIVVDKGIEKAENSGNQKLVVGSLRNPGEVDRVHELGGTVIWIDADPQVRYGRITKNNRGRRVDNKSFEDFLLEEQNEMRHSGDKNTLSMLDVKLKSDIFIDNSDDDIKSFMNKTEVALSDYLNI